MKNLRITSLLAVIILFFASCDKLEEDRPIYDGQALAEVDAAVYNAATTPRTYPILTRVPGYGRPVVTTVDPTITRTSGTIKLRVNLMTAQQSTAQTLTYKVVDSENIGGTPTTVTTAQAGVHYNTTGSFTIPANSSFGEIEVQILNPGPSATARDLVLELVGNGTIKPSVNYSKIAIRIAQN